MARIVVVGAGIAGLNAALKLQDAGLSCSIYEASNRVGGRMHSDTTTWTDGAVSEWCGEFIDGDHETLHQLIKRFGLKTVDLERGRAGQPKRMLYFMKRYFDDDALSRDFQMLFSLLRQQMQEAGFPTTYTSYTETGYRLDHLSVYDWIEQYIEGGHTTPLGFLLESACTGYFGLNTREQSSLNLLYMFGPQTLPKDTTSSQSAQGSCGSCKILGGNQQLPLAMAHNLPEGSIHLRSNDKATMGLS
jgi:monoamine oxidase